MFQSKPLGKFPLLPRKKTTDKTAYGHVLVIGGSKGMTGAARLCAAAALQSGAGLVTCAVAEGLMPYYSRQSVPECMFLALPGKDAISNPGAAWHKALKFIGARRISCVALGPGLGLAESTQSFVRLAVRECPVPLILDADGLNALKGRPEVLLKRRSDLVMTPHEKEFTRVFSKLLPQKETERSELAKKLAAFYHVLLVLKSHRTLVAAGDSVYRNATGNPGMAKGGSGDVLTGIIAGFVAQGLSPRQAAVWGTYFHGLAGDWAVRRTGELSLTASQVIEALPKVFLKKAH